MAMATAGLDWQICVYYQSLIPLLVNIACSILHSLRCLCLRAAAGQALLSTLLMTKG